MGQGNLERTWKVREKSGNLKIHVNGFGRQSSENLFCSRGEMMYMLLDSLSPSPSTLGATLKGKNVLPWVLNLGLLLKERICSLGEQILLFKSTPQI